MNEAIAQVFHQAMADRFRAKRLQDRTAEKRFDAVVTALEQAYPREIRGAMAADVASPDPVT